MDLVRSRDDGEKEESGPEPEPGELLEESWFFGNLLDRKSRMSRCFSDPCPSSKEMLVGKSYEETFSAIKRIQESGHFSRPALNRAPSLPAPCKPREIASPSPSQVKRITNYPIGGKQLHRAPAGNLLRAPSLPLSVDRDEDEESDYSMGRLIRQASLGQSDMLPPRRTPSKSMVPATVPRHRPRRKPELENIKIGGSEEGRRQQLLNLCRNRNSFIADLESEELGLMDSDKKELNPNELEGGKKKKSAEDMKAQIKFWARTVASNVRQEC